LATTSQTNFLKQSIESFGRVSLRQNVIGRGIESDLKLAYAGRVLFTNPLKGLDDDAAPNPGTGCIGANI
jgi:hypothetical protein